MLRGVNEALRSRSPGALRALDSAISCFAIWTLGANTAALCGFGLDTAALSVRGQLAKARLSGVGDIL